MSTFSSLKGYSSSIGFLLKILDAATIIFAGAISYGAHEIFFNGKFSFDDSYIFTFLISAVILDTSLTSIKTYQSWRSSRFTEDIKSIVIGVTVTFLLLLTAVFFLETTNTISRSWALLWYFSTILLMLSLRVLIRLYFIQSSKHGKHIDRILIVGNGKLSNHVIDTILSLPSCGLKIVGLIDDQISKHKEIPTIGSISQIHTIIKQHSISQIWVALSSEEANLLQRVQCELRTTTTLVKLIPDLHGFQLLNHSVSDIAGMPIISLTSSPMYNIKNRLIKRAEDIFFSTLILIAISPMILIIAILVKLSSPGPVFYRQERVSWNGQPFQMLKFRSMLEEEEEYNTISWGNAKKKKITLIGAILRKTSLDELPQFINVLKGDMSIIGPRPERSIFVEQFKYEIPGYMQKHMVKAGISGWAQINGWRGDTDLNKRIEYDLYYIENWSLFFDLKIIFLTIIKGFINKNAI